MSGFDRSTIDKWKGVLPGNELAAMEYLCFDEMVSEGYTPVTGGDEQIEAVLEYKENPEALKPWTVRQGLLLDAENKEREIARRHVSIV